MDMTGRGPVSAWNGGVRPLHQSPEGPQLQYQNRLRHRDYLNLFDAEGFEVIEEQRTDPTEAELEALRRLPLANRFRAYSTAELAENHGHSGEVGRTASGSPLERG